MRDEQAAVEQGRCQSQRSDEWNVGLLYNLASGGRHNRCASVVKASHHLLGNHLGLGFELRRRVWHRLLPWLDLDVTRLRWGSLCSQWA
jgi:hypothetical protein